MITDWPFRLNKVFYLFISVSSAFRLGLTRLWWPIKNGAKMKKDWVEEVGEKKMAAVFHAVMIV